MERALELNPQAGPTHYRLGLIRLAQWRRGEVLAAMEREVNYVFRLLGLALVQQPFVEKMGLAE